jgi:hypothetical protein
MSPTHVQLTARVLLGRDSVLSVWFKGELCAASAGREKRGLEDGETAVAVRCGRRETAALLLREQGVETGRGVGNR